MVAKGHFRPFHALLWRGGGSSRYPLDRRLGGLQSWSARDGGMIILDHTGKVISRSMRWVELAACIKEIHS
jgi:hypothetical protein